MSIDWAGIGLVIDKIISLLAAFGVFIGVYFAAKAKWEAEKAVSESKVTTTKVVTLDNTVERHAKQVASELVAVKSDMKKVEVNTNGMRTELVESKEEAALFRGQLLGMEQQKLESKRDAGEVREQIKEATATLAKVKVTGEDTKKTVEDVKEIVSNGNGARG